jgi:predicted nicotinamide N-methyase
VSSDLSLDTDDVAELEASLRRRFRTVETPVELASRTFTILHPANADDLITEADYVRDERLPYWADLWPSANVLAARVLVEAGRGRSLIELGCGAGLVVSAAAVAGFDVVASDYYADALQFARVNANRNSGRDIAVRLLDWRAMPSDVGTFDVVLASDVLYERAYGPLVAAALNTLLAPAGVALMADPGRIGRDDFLQALGPLGFAVRRKDDVPFEQGAIRQTITIFEIGR